MCADEKRFDTIVIGSGIGGLGAAAALAKCGQRVLVLERHFELGGLTQTFRRGDYQFATGVHYLGGVGEEPGKQNQVGRLLRWLTDERLRFTSVGSTYDIVRFPGMEFPIEAPLGSFIARLKEAFPTEVSAIDQYFKTCAAAQRATMALFAARAVPRPIAALLRWLNSRRALSTTTAETLAQVRDRRLAALLAARGTLYGIPPERASIALHALVTGSYFNGAGYPVGGPAMFAKYLGDTVVAAGGVLRRRAKVERILVEEGCAHGVRLRNGKTYEAKNVISAMGAHNTIAALDSAVAIPWQRAIGSLESGVSYVTLYLGFRGDIAALGASAANVWIYENDDVGRIWEHPGDEDPPSLFVSFPSLKDSAHADPQRHTAEIIVLCRWEPFAEWADSEPGDRPNAYHELKQRTMERVWSAFERHFPKLVPLVDVHEFSTPLSQLAFVGADRGAMYGLEMSPARMRNRALDVRTPVRGLLLAGQDAVSPGIAGAFMGGFMAAAALEPRLWAKLNS